MTTEVVYDKATRKISVTFERKMGMADYGNQTVRVFLEDEVALDAKDDVVSEQAVQMLNVCKASAYETLGIEALVDESGVMREKYTPAATVTQAANQLGTAFPGAEVQAGFDSRGLDVRGELKENVPKFVVDFCEKYGISGVWANDGKYGPFYKEFVPKGDSPKGPVDSQDRPVIIKAGL